MSVKPMQHAWNIWTNCHWPNSCHHLTRDSMSDAPLCHGLVHSYGQRLFITSYTKISQEIPLHIRSGTSVPYFKNHMHFLMASYTCNYWCNISSLLFLCITYNSIVCICLCDRVSLCAADQEPAVNHCKLRQVQWTVISMLFLTLSWDRPREIFAPLLCKIEWQSSSWPAGLSCSFLKVIKSV